MQDKDYLENDKEKDTPEGVIHTESTEQEEHDYERFCFLCRRPESQTGKLITLTDGISVCPDCMQKTMDTIQNGNIDFSRLQGVNFMNLSDLQNMMSNQQQVKKKKLKKEGPKPAFDIRSIPAPHKQPGRIRYRTGSCQKGYFCGCIQSLQACGHRNPGRYRD